MSGEDVKLPNINSKRGQSQGSNFNRQGSFNSLTGAAGNALKAKKERQDCDRDAQLLANRIALLKQEEMKTWKKIEETRRRATEVSRLKQKNAQVQMEKIQQEDMRRQKEFDTKNRIAMQRQDRNQEKAKIQDAILLHKQEEAKQAKFIGHQNKQRGQQQQMRIEQENNIRMEKQRRQEQIQRAKVEEFKRRKQEAAREDIARQIAEEEEAIRQKEAEVMQMEMLEMELIKKLQNTQQIQKRAYEELEDAINNKPESQMNGQMLQPQFRHHPQGASQQLTDEDGNKQ